MSGHGPSHAPAGGSNFLGKPLRNTVATVGGLAVLINAVKNGAFSIGTMTGQAGGAISGLGTAALNGLQNISPAAIAGAAAPFATAVAALYLTNHGLDMAGVENILARRTAQAASLVAGAGATVMAPLTTGIGLAVAAGELGIAGWNKAWSAWKSRGGHSHGGSHHAEAAAH